MSKLDISLIGRFRLVTADSAGVHLPTRKAEGLVAFLAAHLGRPQSRATLADLFWSRSADEQARASLRQELARVRKALGVAAECLSASAREIGLNADCARSDLAELDRLLQSERPQDVQAAFDLFVDSPSPALERSIRCSTSGWRTCATIWHSVRRSDSSSCSRP